MKSPLSQSFLPAHTSLRSVGVDRFRLLLKGWGVKVLSLLLVVMVGGSVWGQLTEGFESGLTTSYQTSQSNNTLGSGTWSCLNVLRNTGNQSAGTYCAQIKNANSANATSPSLNTVGTITFNCIAGTAGTNGLKIQKSISGGAYSDVQTFTISNTSNNQYTCTVNDLSSNVTIRFLSMAVQTIYLDAVTITSYAATTNYYSKSNGNLELTSSWTTDAAGGTGTAPSNFTTANQVFNVRNNASPTIGAAWTVSGSGSKIVVGDGTNACNFTIPALYTVTGTVDVAAGATLINTNTTNPTLGTLNATSTVEFNAAGAQTVPAATYGNLKVNTTTANATAGGAIVLAATTTLSVGNGSVFDLGANALTGGATSFTTFGTGTIKTQNTTATPLPTGKTWTMDVEYNGSGAQTIVTGTYNNVTLSTARTSNPAITLGSGTITIGNIFSVTATGVGSYVNTGNTVDFSKATTQTIPAINYLNITNTGNGVRTLANGVIKIASTFTPGSGNYTIGSSTIEFNGSTVQTIPVLAVTSGGNYYNLTYSGSSIGTINGSATITISGDLTVSSGTLSVNGTSTTRVVNISGNFVQSGGTFDGGSFNVSGGVTSVLNLSGNFSKSSGTFSNSASSSSFTLNFAKTGSQSFSNSGTFTYANIYINSSSTVTALTNIPNANGALIVNGTLDLDAYQITNLFTSSAVAINGILKTKKVNGLIDATTSSAISSTNTTTTIGVSSTIEYNASSTQTVTARADYGNITLSGGGAKTLGGSSAISGTLSLTSGTLTVGANTLTLSGSTINRDGTTYTGNIDASNASATVAFTNASALTIPASTFTGTCKNITMNGAGGITLASDLTIGGILTFTSGKITTGANKVILTSTGTVSRTSGHVVGNLQKNVAVSATTKTFEIGDASNYSPITLALTSVTVAGDLTANTTIPGSAPAAASGIHPTKYLKRFWTLTNSGITLTSFDPTFTFVSGDIQGSATTSSFLGAKLTSSSWSNPTVGTLTSTSSQLTGVTTFGDFYLGEPGTPSVTTLAASSITTSGAVLNGTVNDNGSTTTPGFEYGATTAYGSTGTTSPSSIAAASGITDISSTIGSLSVNTLYNFRANATNNLGTSNGSNLSFYTLANVPGTPTVNNPTNTTLDVLIDVNSNPSNTQFAIQETGGNYVQANGSLGVSAVWQTASVWGTETVTGLSGGTVYTFQVKARNGDNTATSFGTSANGTTTSSVVPTISTPTATAILSTTATLGGNVESDGGAAITARGVVWAETSLNNAPQLSGANVSFVTGTGTTGVFTTAVTSLPSATQISYSAYATNSQGTSYTTPSTLYTLATEPSIQATSIVFSNQTASSLSVSWTNGNGGRRAVFMKAAAAGVITNPSDANLYSASSDWNSPGTQLGTSGYYCIYDGTGNTVTVTNLSAETVYYVQVFEYNSNVTPTAATINYFTATATGNPANSITLSSNLSSHAASFSAAAASTTSLTLSYSSANTIPNADGYIILQKTGNTAPTGTPTNATNYSVGNTIGDGTVAAKITSLSATSTTINGLAYASTYSFTLIPYNWNGNNLGTYNYYTAATIPSATGTTNTPIAPIISLPTSASVSVNTATLGGNVTSDGGDPVIERGIVWSVTSLNADPLIGAANVTTISGLGTTGIYTVATSGLPTGVSISYKAYATNNIGTSYTTVGTFSTLAAEPTAQASNITFTNVGMNSMTINWNNGNGTNRMVVVKASGAPGTPSDGQTYIANTIFGSGSTFGTSEYVVYIGNNNTVDITGLTASITYSVKVFEYNGSGASVNYLTTSNNTSQTTAALTYYSNGSVDPALTSSWKTARNGSGNSPTNFTSGEIFVIESGDAMTTTSTWAISGTNSKLQIESGGTLTANHAITLTTATTFQIDNGGTYIHNNTSTASSTIFAGTESFGASSNMRIDNWINNTTVITTGVTLPFGNLELNYTSNTSSWQQSWSGNINLTAGNFIVTSVGSGNFRFTGSSAPTITIAGDFTQAASTVILASSSGSTVTTLNVGGNFAVNGGTFTSTSTGSKVVFNKSGSQSFTNGGTISIVNFEVGASSILDLGTSVLSGGSFTIPSGATLKTAHASGIPGAITATTKLFSSGANYEFNGAATGAFTTTPTANTVNDLTINKSSGVVTLSQSLKTNGALTLTSGTLDIGANTLTIAGSVSRTNGNIDADAGTLSFANTNNLSLPTSLFSGNIYNLSKASGAGTVTLTDDLTVTNELTSAASIGAFIIPSSKVLTVSGTGKATINGTLTNDGTFTLNSGATLLQGDLSSISGGAYNVKQAVTGSGLSTPNGRFWYLGSPLSDASSTALLSSTGNQLWQWNESSFAYATVSTGQTLTQGRSYVLRSGQTSETINFSGTSLSNGTVNVTGLSRTGTAQTYRGCHLISNPYPSYLDWNAITKTNIGTTMYIRTAIGTTLDVMETFNSVGSIATTISSLPLTRYIAPMQGFWVKVSGDNLTGSLTMTNAMRSHQNGSGLRSSAQDFPAFLRLNMLDGQNKDQVILLMSPDAMMNLDAFDSEKMSASGYAQFYSTVNAKKLVINGMKNVKAKTSVPLTLEMPTSKSYTFQAEEFNIEDGLILLEDKQEGVIQDLTINPTYSFFGNAGTNATRFVVHFQLASAPILVGGPQELESLGSDELTTENIRIISNNQGKVTIRLDEGFKPEGSIRIFDASGRLVEQRDFNDQETTIQLNEQSGMYFVEVAAGKLMVKKKIVIE